METIIGSVLHPTDFSQGSKVAFYHALKAALVSGSTLTLLNVASDGRAAWSDFPGVRETLEDWGLIPNGSPRSAVAGLGINIVKTIARNHNPVRGVVEFLTRHPAELIVLATHVGDGKMRWLDRSVAEPIARQAGEMTLFITGSSSGFVSGDDGSVWLREILIPVASQPRPQPAVDAAVRLVDRFKCGSGTFRLLHVGNPSSMPAVRTPNVAGWDWTEDIRQGDVLECILSASRDNDSDLIVMTTEGHNGFLDGLRGSHSERVLRQAGIPLLVIPVGSYVSDTLV